MSLIFVDTNVLVYAYDKADPDRHRKARAILKKLWIDQSLVLSTQVLQEFYVTVTRKLVQPLSPQQARDIMRDYQIWPIQSPTAADVLAASELQEVEQLSFWDAMIVTAAQNVGATTLLSEDMQHRRRIGMLQIVNPFR